MGRGAGNETSLFAYRHQGDAGLCNGLEGRHGVKDSKEITGGRRAQSASGFVGFSPAFLKDIYVAYTISTDGPKVWRYKGVVGGERKAKGFVAGRSWGLAPGFRPWKKENYSRGGAPGRIFFKSFWWSCKPILGEYKPRKSGKDDGKVDSAVVYGF